MKNTLSKFIKNNFQYYAFLLIAFAIPFTKEYLPYAMALWVLTGILSIKKLKKGKFQHLILLAFPFAYYLFHIIGLLYTSDIGNGLFDLQVKLSILFIPFVSVFITEKVRLNYRLLLKLFVFGNFIASLICLLYAALKCISYNDVGDLIFETSNWPTITKGLSFFELINHRLSLFSYTFLSIFHHPTYFSVYLMFSLAILVCLIRSSKKRHVLYYVLIIYFSIFIWLLGSRAGYITYLISFFSFILIIILKFRKYSYGIGALAIGVILSLLVLTNGQILKNIRETTEIVENNQSLTKDSDIRLWLWKSGVEVFKDHLMFGVGTGDIDEFLNKKYLEYGLEDADEHNYNTHNQYLDVAIKIGVFGLAAFLLWIFATLYVALKKRHFLLFFFMLIVAINLFFENMLNTIAGVSFIAFFYSLLAAGLIHKKERA